MENKSAETSELNDLINKYSPYLSDIRKRIIFTLLFFLVSMLSGFIFYERIIKFVIDILALRGINIVFTSPFQFINLAISCGVATGLVLTFPLLIYQILSFLKPALRVKEFKMIVGLLPFSILLFLTGFSFGVLIMKWQIQLFLTKSISLGIGNILDISSLISTVLLVSVAMGIAFQFPIIILILTRIGIIKQSQLIKQRPWVYLGSFIFSILLPLDSILADVLLTLPLVILFELTIIFNRIFEKRDVGVLQSPYRYDKFMNILQKLAPVFIILALIGAGAGGYFYFQYQKASTELQTIKNDPNTLRQAAEDEVKKLVAEVGNLIALPIGEEPTVVTITDIEKLKDQPFFKDAKNGDKVIIYTQAKKAILYDPVAKKIIDAAPVNIGSASATLAAPPKVSSSPKAVVKPSVL